MDEAAVRLMIHKQRAQEEAAANGAKSTGEPAKKRAASSAQTNGRVSIVKPMQFGEPVAFGPPAGSGPCEAAVIFLHGLGDRPGSWGDKFKSLRNKCSQRWKWVHLRAPKLAQPFKNGEKMPSWGKVYSTETMHVGARDHEDKDTEGLYLSAAEAVRGVVETLHEKYGVPAGKVVICGFSQGAAVSLLTALSFPKLFAGCTVFSGWLLPRARDIVTGTEIPNAPPILMCHGTADDIVGHDCAEFAASYLQSAGQNVRFESFDGLGHSTNARLMKIVANFVHESLTGRELQPLDE